MGAKSRRAKPVRQSMNTLLPVCGKQAPLSPMWEEIKGEMGSENRGYYSVIARHLFSSREE